MVTVRLCLGLGQKCLTTTDPHGGQHHPHYKTKNPPQKPMTGYRAWFGSILLTLLLIGKWIICTNKITYNIMLKYSIEFLFSSERHYNLFPALTPSSDVTELKLKTLCLRLLCVKIWAGNSKFVFASFFKKYLGFPLPCEYDKGKLLLFRFYCWFLQ